MESGSVLVVNKSQVDHYLSMQDCIQVLRPALLAFSRKQVLNPLRTVMWLPDKQGATGFMPSYRTSEDGHSSIGVKLITVFPENTGTNVSVFSESCVLIT
jgi:ornithine cyclodeaminase/alanine dehydrogenase-like protein (mu-crystallin family)